MLPVARLMDTTIGICIAHPPVVVTEIGFVISSQFTILSGGLPVIKMLDTAISGCGLGTGIIISGSNKVFVQGLPMAHMGSYFVGTYTGTILGGSSNVFCA